MSVFELFTILNGQLRKLPGSPASQAFVLAATLCTGLVYPIFFQQSLKESRQEHEYFRSDKPEQEGMLFVRGRGFTTLGVEKIVHRDMQVSTCEIFSLNN